MKILQITTISDTLNAFLIPHINALQEQGHEVELACCIEEPLAAPLQKLVCHELSLRRNPLALGNISAYHKLRQLLRTGRYDVVHTHTPNASAITRLAARDCDLCVMYTAHGFHFYTGAPRLNWLVYHKVEKFLARYTDKLITINQEDYQRACGFSLRHGGSVHLINGIGTDITVVRQPQAVAAIKKAYQLKAEDKVIVFAAELSDRKNQGLLIDAMAQLVQAGKDYRLFLLGAGKNEERYRRQIREQNLERHVFLTGFQKDVRPYLELADVIASSSKQEGLPVNVMEAFAYGVPAVLTNIRGHEDLITERNQGLLVKTSRELAEGIDFVLSHQEQFVPTLSDKFSTQAAVRAMDTIYQEMEGEML